MTQEDKQIVLVDLCARSVYGVMCDRLGIARKVLSINPNKTQCIELDRGEYMPAEYSLEEVKPYLRSMSSMTDEEKKEYYTFQYKFTLQAHEYQELNKETFSEYLDWLNKKMFDYRGLIPKGLAIEAPEGMYL